MGRRNTHTCEGASISTHLHISRTPERVPRTEPDTTVLGRVAGGATAGDGDGWEEEAHEKW